MDLESLLGGGEGLKGLMEQAQKMQQQMQEAQARAERIEVVGESGGGLVSVKANGKQEVISITLDPVAVDPRDIEMLQDLITAAVNVALKKAQDAVSSEMGPLGDMMKSAGLKPG